MTTPIATTLAGINPQPRSKTDEKTNWQRLADICRNPNGITIDANGRLTISLIDAGGLVMIDGALKVDLEANGNLQIGPNKGIEVDYEIVTNEIPTGPVNGVNHVFTLAHQPLPNSVAVYVNQLRVAYSLAGSTLILAIAPGTLAVLRVDYRWLRPGFVFNLVPAPEPMSVSSGVAFTGGAVDI